MIWFEVSVTWDEDNEYLFLVEAETEAEARAIALVYVPSPKATVTNRLEAEDVGDEAVTMDYDRVIPAGGED